MSLNLPLPLAETRAGLRARVAAWRADGLRVGFVPTMGALHAGHLALITRALTRADRVVASIFVNPAQFAPGEDFEAYPRTLDSDAAKLADAGCHLLYAPSAREMYPDGYASQVLVKGPALHLESAARPHFFTGVATVVTKLFNQVRPDLAVFGEKDYQQLLVIRRLVRDLDLDIEIIAGPTAREADGLALSSRNAYLSAEDRQRAAALNVILQRLAAAIAGGGSIRQALDAARAEAEAAFDAVDYIEARCADTLSPLNEDVAARPVRVLAAVRVGGVRLIDNRSADPR